MSCVDDVSRCQRRASRRRSGILLCVALGMLGVLGDAGAQIFKCTDVGGSVTYQNAPCPKGVKSDRVEITESASSSDGDDKEAQWRRQASEHRVLAGMPARWVRESLGVPAEVRGTTAGGASELWVYNLLDRSVQIGMLDGQVVWSRDAPTGGVATSPPAGPVTPATGIKDAPAPRAASPEPRAPIAASAPAGVHSAASLRGRDCAQVVSELGAPTRTRDLSAAEAGTEGPVREYYYEPSGTDQPMRTRIVCAGGKVEGVDRSAVR